MKRFDIIVIGAGAAGLNIASFMNKAGFSVLLVDKSDKHIGGDCLNFGCVPSKALIHVARQIHEARKSKEFGFSLTGEISMRSLSAHIKRVQEAIRIHENADFFRRGGITVVLGEARFVGKRSIQVGEEQFSAKNIILATGARPRMLSIPGIESAPVYDNESIFDIQFLPKRLVVVGAGPIGAEIGQAFSHLGSAVTIIDKGGQFLPKDDPDTAGVLLQRLKHDGIVCLPNTDALRVENENTLVVRRDGAEEKIAFDALFIGIGRVIDISPLAPERAGIRADERGRPIVDPYMRTTNKHIWASGDVVGGLQFTHATELHASIILHNLFSPFKKKLATEKFSWVTYTNPEVATFGLSERTLREEKIRFEILTQSFEEDDRAIIGGYTYGLLKLFISPSGKIFGGSMAAPDAGELVQELLLANSADVSLDELFKKVYPYPTATRINKRAVGGYMKRKVTPISKRLLHFLYH